MNDMTSLPMKIKTIASAPVIANKKGERLFYTGMAIVIAVTVFVGFSQRYYLRSFFYTEPLNPLVHLHAILNTCWIVIFLVQNVLVASNRTHLHRRLGIVGIPIALSMILVGTVTAVIRAKHGGTVPDVPPLVFLAVPLGDIFVFSVLVGAEIFYRRRPDIHKRLMLLATISILNAAVARLPFSFLELKLPMAYGITYDYQAWVLTIDCTADMLIVACFIYDLISRRRIHRATALGGLLILISQPMRLVIGDTNAWIVFAGWLTKLVG